MGRVQGSSSLCSFVTLLASTLLHLSSALEMKKIPVVSVTGLRGGVAALPCDVSRPPDDSISLVLWFRDPLTTPIYRLDERWLGRGRERHWADPQELGSRASLEVGSSPALLRVSHLRLADQGLYTCRVDFKLQPTKTTRVNLTVVVPPESVRVMTGGAEGGGRVVTSVVGPYHEGDMLVLTCVAHGGIPRPSVVWFKDTHLLDSHMESYAQPPDELGPMGATDATNTTVPTKLNMPLPPTRTDSHATPTLSPGSPSVAEGEPYNTLTLGPLTRNDLKLLLTCEASNNNLTLPTSLVVMVDMNLPALSVEVTGPEQPLMAGREYRVVCEVRGSRPPPTIIWYLNNTRLLTATDATSGDGNITTSSLVFTPQPEHDDAMLRCLAETHADLSALEDTVNLTVHYLPTATARFGSSLDATNIKEGDDVYFECSVHANPPVLHVTWRHNNVALHHEIEVGVIISNMSLVLQGVRREQAGRYSCHAHNEVGDAGSPPLRLDVKYAPVCAPGQVTRYAVSRNEDAEVTCSVQANPLQATFHWTFNNTADMIDVPQGSFTSSSSHSVITYTPIATLDYGTLLCWASNNIGSQQKPCIFHIVPAGKPEPPQNCTAGQRTRTSVRVRCTAGDSGGLPQHFLLQASLEDGGTPHSFNLTSSSPTFYVEGLRSGGRYRLTVSAHNQKGSSKPVLLTLTGSPRSSGSSFQARDGPSEAEVRDGKNGAGGNGSGSSEGVISGNGSNSSGRKKYLGVLSMPSLIPAALGIGAGLIFIIIVLILLITFRTRRPGQRRHSRHEDSPGKDSDAGDTATTTPSTAPAHHHHHHQLLAAAGHHSPTAITHHTTCLERETQVESESDAEPDVIPLQEGCRPPDLEPPPATLLPPNRYQYGPVPAHSPPTASPCSSRSAAPTLRDPACALHVAYDIPPLPCPQPSQRPTTLPRHPPRPPAKARPPVVPAGPALPLCSELEDGLPPPPLEYQSSREEEVLAGQSQEALTSPQHAKRESSV
ncbi:nephrin-like isoform X1 [Portunus trituberculatus]|uniref:nephrin-like isoform X1 n=1 Tax=Portunus trituberculatus TaxID=210409 RepID=UPI001E1CCE13|nr:nephrin-like isoform X1 [Portunus trituberculatus]